MMTRKNNVQKWTIIMTKMTTVRMAASKPCKYCYDCTSQHKLHDGISAQNITSTSIVIVSASTDACKMSYKAIPILDFMSLTPGESVVSVCECVCILESWIHSKTL